MQSPSVPIRPSMYRNLVDDLHLLVVAERETDNLSSLNTRTIEQAQAAMISLEDEIRQTQNFRLYEPYDAIADHMGTLVTFRTKKMMGFLGSERPVNATEEEARFQSTLVTLVTSLRATWGLKD